MEEDNLNVCDQCGLYRYECMGACGPVLDFCALCFDRAPLVSFPTDPSIRVCEECKYKEHVRIQEDIEGDIPF